MIKSLMLIQAVLLAHLKLVMFLNFFFCFCSSLLCLLRYSDTGLGDAFSTEFGRTQPHSNSFVFLRRS